MPDLALTIQLGGAPAPFDVVNAIQLVEVETTTDMASAFRLRLGIAESRTGDWTILQTDYFRPLAPVTIRVSNRLGLPEALINGYALSQNVQYAQEPTQSVLEVTGFDATVLMNLQEKVMAWPNMSDSVIATAILPQYGLVPRVETTPPRLTEPEGTTMQRGTDIRFLRRLAQRNGFECYVQPDPVTGLDQGFFQAPQTSPGVPQAVLNVAMGTETNVSEFSVSYQMARPTGAIGAGLDTATKAVQAGVAPASTRFPMGAEPALLRVVPPPTVRPVGTGLMSSGELQASFQAIADESSLALVAHGTVGGDVGILRPGGIVNVRGLGRVFNGSWYLTRVTHTISPETGHAQRFQARRNAVTQTGAELFVSP